MPDPIDYTAWAKLGFASGDTDAWVGVGVRNPVVASMLEIYSVSHVEVKERKLNKIAKKAGLSGVWSLVFNGAASGGEKPVKAPQAVARAAKKKLKPAR